jgi:restriction system protein
MTASKVPEGIFITSSTFNDEATRFALKNNIDLINGARLLKLIYDRPATDQARLLEVATEGDYLTPTCPNCGIKLVKRENSKDKSIFWACTNYRCKVTLNA